jgi:DNA-binding response OmpR family regulator
MSQKPALLVVEDEEILREAYRAILGTQGYDVEVAPDGDTALAMCKKTAFDLILLDLMMPKVDGVAFLRRYKQSELPDVQIIILSNLSSGEELAKAQSLGAHANFVKADMSPRELLKMVEVQLKEASNKHA